MGRHVPTDDSLIHAHGFSSHPHNGHDPVIEPTPVAAIYHVACPHEASPLDRYEASSHDGMDDAAAAAAAAASTRKVPEHSDLLSLQRNHHHVMNVAPAPQRVQRRRSLRTPTPEKENDRYGHARERPRSISSYQSPVTPVAAARTTYLSRHETPHLFQHVHFIFSGFESSSASAQLASQVRAYGGTVVPSDGLTLAYMAQHARA
jgi:hypothetical protein